MFAANNGVTSIRIGMNNMCTHGTLGTDKAYVNEKLRAGRWETYKGNNIGIKN